MVLGVVPLVESTESQFPVELAATAIVTAPLVLVTAICCEAGCVAPSA